MVPLVTLAFSGSVISKENPSPNRFRAVSLPIRSSGPTDMFLFFLPKGSDGLTKLAKKKNS